MTNFATHFEQFSHDQLNRYSRRDKLKPQLIWEQVKDSIVFSENGYLLFDDTVADKNYSFAIESVRRQYAGKTKSIIKGIGIVTCVYVNPEPNRFGLIDYRILGRKVDSKSKLDHVREMFDKAIKDKRLEFCTVLMDSRCAAKELMRRNDANLKLRQAKMFISKIFQRDIGCNYSDGRSQPTARSMS